MAGSTETTLVTRVDVVRIGIGWGAFVLLLVAHPLLVDPSTPVLVGALLAITAVIVVAAFGVVKQAEALAHRLGDPYGSLVLTLSIVLIEVVLIAAVLLGPGEHATIARDSVMAVAMVVLGLVIGLCLLLGGRRHGDLEYNRTGASAYLAMLVVLSAFAFALPVVLGRGGAYAAGQEIPVIAITLVLYGYFLVRQTGAQKRDFQEMGSSTGGPPTEAATPVTAVLRRYRREIVTRLVVLVATVIPIVLLSHDMATLLDEGLGRIGAPVALAGAVIAVIVFLPESVTAVRAALAGEMQRVINLCQGALVSTVGLTIPVVLVIGLATGQTIVLGGSPANLLLLGVTLLLAAITFASKRVSAIHGAVHVAVFAAYGLALFAG